MISFPAPRLRELSLENFNFWARCIWPNAYTSRGKTTSTVSNGSFSQSNKEPWLLATNLPLEVTPVDIVNLYFKRMQIEESFRDMKSHQFGLAGRYVRTHCVNRWH